MCEMDNFNEGGAIHRSKIVYPPKNRAKVSYEDQVECNYEKKISSLIRYLVKS